MPFDYDILITGAGPAGCAAAYDLARAGKRVLLLEKRSFPRHKACACGLTRKTLNALRYSVTPVTERICHEIVLQIGNPPGASNTPGAGAPGLASETWVSRKLPVADKSREVRVKTRDPICAMAVRERFDDFCLQQTLAMGAELKKIDSILALRELPTHIELDLATPEGPITLTAPVLIGADGSNGQTRRLANLLGHHDGAPPPSAQDPAWYTRGFALEATVPYADLPAQLPGGDQPTDLVFDFAPLPGGYGWLFPKGDHINIGVGAFAPRPASTPGAPCLDSETWASTELKSVTRQLLLDYTRQKLGLTTLHHITGQHLGMGGHAYIPRGRVLLTGDAAGLVDPLTGEGIHSAIVSGQAAATAILKVMPSLKGTGTELKRTGTELKRTGTELKGTGTELKGTGFSPSVGAAKKNGALAPEGDLAAAYARELHPLQQTLAFSARAARAFYRQPERGFRAMRLPFLRSLILKTYADGLPHTRLLTALAKLV